jgi:hypothetical protein
MRDRRVCFTKRLCFSIVILLSYFFSFAQQGNFSITGAIVDSLSGQPIEYATITVFQKGNTKPVNGTSTNHAGLFSIDNLSAGKYTLTIDFIGYRTISKDISPGARQPVVNLQRSGRIWGILLEGFCYI